MPRMSKRMSRKSGKSRRVKRTSHKYRKLLGGSAYPDPTMWPTELMSTYSWRNSNTYKKQQANKKKKDEEYTTTKAQKQKIYNTKKQAKANANAKVKAANAANAAKVAKEEALAREASNNGWNLVPAWSERKSSKKQQKAAKEEVNPRSKVNVKATRAASNNEWEIL
jgi:hypothetical protein